MAGQAAASNTVEPAPDLETRAGPDDHDALRLWLRMLATTNLIEAHVRRELHRRFGTTLPRFDLMAQLYREPRGLKMGELSRRMMVTGGNVTGVADLLERDGLITRTDDPRDRRASYLALTESGRTQFRAMAAMHEEWIVESFTTLTRAEIRTLSALFGKVKAAARAADGRKR